MRIDSLTAPSVTSKIRDASKVRLIAMLAAPVSHGSRESERRIFPAIHVLKSGTRRDDLLYHPEEFKRISLVRKQMTAVPAFEAIELLIRNINKTANNAELLIKGLRS